MRSEEINKLNKALKYCDELKVNLQATLLYVQTLNNKYNTKEAYELEERYGFTALDTSSRSMCSSPIQMQTGTPERLNRSLQDIKQANNTIIVRGIKVRREVETVINQLKRIREQRQKEPILSSPYKRRLSSTVSTPDVSPNTTVRSHRCCFEDSPTTSTTLSPFAFKAINNNHYFSTPVNRRRLIEKKRLCVQLSY